MGLESDQKEIKNAIEKWDINNFRKSIGDEKLPEKERMVRKAKSGGWKNFFNENHKKITKELVGDYLIKFDYEKDNKW